MFLAYQYRYDKNVILAYVNYNIRQDTYIDQEIVENFAKKYHLKLEKLILDKNTNHSNSNFENWAREIRYDFFKSLYKKYQCKQLLIAHHKDDFLETCIMQKEKNEDKLFYGIKEKIRLNQMNIYRPLLLKYWKHEIYDLVQKHKINYHDDYTNFESNYKRNYIRNNILNKYSLAQKEELLNEFLNFNKSQAKIIKNIKKEYKEWFLSGFKLDFFSNLKYQEEVVKLFINKNLKNINLNRNIINNIIKFLLSSNNNKEFLLSNNNFILKKNNKVYIKRNNYNKIVH